MFPFHPFQLTTIRSFLDYVGRWGEYEEYDKLKVEDEQSFITALRDVSDINQSVTFCSSAVIDVFSYNL